MKSIGASIPTNQCPRCLQPVPVRKQRCPNCGDYQPAGMRKITLYLGAFGLLALVFVIGLMVAVIHNEDIMNQPPEQKESDQAPPLPEQPVNK
jgi:hypothetical protein